MKYTDPDGEYAVLVAIGIGAAVGYISGRAAGLRSWQLAEYTIASGAIGGLSGGIGAAVGAGVAGAVSIGGFAGGFIAGAAGGAAGGFVGGSLGTSLNNSTFYTQNNVWIGGLKGAGIGAAAGGLLGGVVGGVDAANNDRNFWTGKKPNFDYILEEYDLVPQDDPLNCKNATLESMEKLSGGTRTQEDFKLLGDQFLSEKPNFNASLEEYFEHFGFDVRDPSGWGPREIGRGMELGNPTVISENISSSQQHTVTITRIRQWTPRGKVKVWFADPARGSWGRSWNSTVANPNFNNGSYLFWIK